LKQLILVCALALFGTACGGGSSGPEAGHGARLLGLEIDEAADGDFDAAADLAQAAGVEVVPLSLSWSAIETAPGVYDPTLLDIIDLFFPARGLKLNLVVDPLNTVRREVPADLEAVPFDDPVMLQRFAAFLDFLFSRIPNTDIHAFFVGNEIDGVLESAESYARYTVFFKAARDHAKALRPGLRVGFTAMWDGLVVNEPAALQPLNAEADFVGVTYYDLGPGAFVRDPTSVGADFDALAALYPGQPIVFNECGYPSSPDTNSSLEMQRWFVVEAFKAWDRHAAQIENVCFFMQHDWSAATVDGFLVYYGIATPAFRGYLASLGLRTHDGTDKPAWNEFKAQAAARGW